MSKCLQCGEEYESKRSTSEYCSIKCKSAFYRNRMKPDTVMLDTLKSDTVTDLEKCRYCGIALRPLQNPRKYPGACYECAIKQPAKPVQPANEGHILASRPALEFTGKLTAFEREHYKPASELKPGEYNPVSKPGDEHYGIY